MKIIDDQIRESLSEGRDFGIGYSILNKEGSKYRTLLPFTACRDYFNDFIYVENTKKEIGEIHGYNHKLLNCFKNKSYFYLGVNCLHYNGSETEWCDYDKSLNLLLKNKDEIVQILNYFERKLGLPRFTTVTSMNEEGLLFKVPMYWAKSTPLISVYTLIIRCFFNMQDVNASNDLYEQLFESDHQCMIGHDTYMINATKWFYDNITQIKFNNIKYNKMINIDSNSDIHNFGINEFKNKNK